MLRGMIAGALLIGMSCALPVQAQVDKQETEGQKEAKQQQAEPSAFSVRVVGELVQIIKELAESETRQRQQEITEQREQDALVIQRALEEANRRMADAAEKQSWIVGAGTAALIVTLLLMLHANRAAWAGANAAERSVAVAEKASMDRLRAYIATTRAIAKFEESGRLVVIAQIQNTGATPTRRVFGGLEAQYFPASDCRRFFFKKGKMTDQGEIGSQSSATCIDAINDIDIKGKIERGDGAVEACGYISYRDVFGRKFRTLFSYRLSIDSCPRNKDGSYIMAISDRGNRST